MTDKSTEKPASNYIPPALDDKWLKYYILQSELEAAKHRIRHLERALDRIAYSGCWRYTAPFRWATKIPYLTRQCTSLMLNKIRHPKKIAQFIKKNLNIYQKHGWQACYYSLTRVLRNLIQQQHYQRNYTHWLKFMQRDPSAQLLMKSQFSNTSYQPLLSLIMILDGDSHLVGLENTLASLKAQNYQSWELIIINRTSHEIKASWDPSLTVQIHHQPDLNLTEAYNFGFSKVAGAYTGFIYCGDSLVNHALMTVVKYLNEHPTTQILYSDEDRVKQNNRRYDPDFKSDWNPLLFLNYNYLGNLLFLNTQTVRDIGTLDATTTQIEIDYLILQILKKHPQQTILHVPFILYHRQQEPKLSQYTQRLMLKNRIKMLQKYCDDSGIKATVLPNDWDPSKCRIAYHLPQPAPKVSIVIPTKDKADLLKVCIDSVLEKTSYPNYEIIVIDNNSIEPATQEYFASLADKNNIRVVAMPIPFNYSKINNDGVKLATGSIICLMNNDIEVISPGWLEEMVSLATLPDVGAVGAKLYYPNDTIQHAGVVLGIGGVAHHVFNHLDRDTQMYCYRALHCQQDFSAVTGACMVIRREVYDQVGGLNEQLAVAYNDIDFCIKLKKAGYRIIWTPYAELYHHESATRGSDHTPKNLDRYLREVEYMQTTHSDFLLQDPFYNPNLSLHIAFDFAYPPRLKECADAEQA